MKRARLTLEKVFEYDDKIREKIPGLYDWKLPTEWGKCDLASWINELGSWEFISDVRWKIEEIPDDTP